MATGTLYGIGVGPGDPELLTLKAYRLLKETPVICVPKRNLRDDGYAANIVQGYLEARAGQEILPLEFPMTRDWERLKPYWDQNVACIYERIAQGKDCVFITEGDPLLYSTFIYMMEYMHRLHPAVPIAVVPGVSSFLAAAATTRFPLGTQEDRIAIIAAVKDQAEVEQLLDQFQTVIFLKINSAFDHVLGALTARGLVDKAVWVLKASAPGLEEVVTDIRSLQDRGRLPYLSLLMVRTVAPSTSGHADGHLAGARTGGAWG